MPFLNLNGVQFLSNWLPFSLENIHMNSSSSQFFSLFHLFLIFLNFFHILGIWKFESEFFRILDSELNFAQTLCVRRSSNFVFFIRCSSNFVFFIRCSRRRRRWREHEKGWVTSRSSYYPMELSWSRFVRGAVMVAGSSVKVGWNELDFEKGCCWGVKKHICSPLMSVKTNYGEFLLTHHPFHSFSSWWDKGNARIFQ
jgi:hypothetical protein